MPTIAAIELEIKRLREIPPWDSLVGHLIDAKEITLAKRREASRASLPVWKQRKELGRKIERAKSKQDKLAARKAALDCHAAALLQEGRAVDDELREMRARITSLQAVALAALAAEFHDALLAVRHALESVHAYMLQQAAEREPSQPPAREDGYTAGGTYVAASPPLGTRAPQAASLDQSGAEQRRGGCASVGSARHFPRGPSRRAFEVKRPRRRR
jgi:hypothetical protein